MKKTLLHIKKIIPAITGLVLLLHLCHSSFSQVNTFFIKGATTHSIEISFVNEEIEINKGEIISNVLRIKNISSDSLKVFVSLNYPPFWKTLFVSDRMYEISANDSIFIPVRIIPRTPCRSAPRASHRLRSLRRSHSQRYFQKRSQPACV